MPLATLAARVLVQVEGAVAGSSPVDSAVVRALVERFGERRPDGTFLIPLTARRMGVLTGRGVGTVLYHLRKVGAVSVPDAGWVVPALPPRSWTQPPIVVAVDGDGPKQAASLHDGPPAGLADVAGAGGPGQLAPGGLDLERLAADLAAAAVEYPELELWPAVARIAAFVSRDSREPRESTGQDVVFEQVLSSPVGKSSADFARDGRQSGSRDADPVRATPHLVAARDPGFAAAQVDRVRVACARAHVGAGLPKQSEELLLALASGFPEAELVNAVDRLVEQITAPGANGIRNGLRVLHDVLANRRADYLRWREPRPAAAGPVEEAVPAAEEVAFERLRQARGALRRAP